MFISILSSAISWFSCANSVAVFSVFFLTCSISDSILFTRASAPSARACASLIRYGTSFHACHASAVFLRRSISSPQYFQSKNTTPLLPPNATQCALIHSTMQTAIHQCHPQQTIDTPPLTQAVVFLRERVYASSE